MYSEEKTLRIGYFSTWRFDSRQPQDKRDIDPNGWKRLPFNKDNCPDLLFVEGLDRPNETNEYDINRRIELFNTSYLCISKCEKQIILQKMESKAIPISIPTVVRTIEVMVNSKTGLWLSICGIHFQAPYCYYDKQKKEYIKNFSKQTESIKSFNNTYNDNHFKDVLFGDFNVDIGNYKGKSQYDIEQDKWMRSYQAKFGRELLYSKDQFYTQIKDNGISKQFHYLDYAYVNKEYMNYIGIRYGKPTPNLSDHTYFELLVHTI